MTISLQKVAPTSTAKGNGLDLSHSGPMAFFDDSKDKPKHKRDLMVSSILSGVLKTAVNPNENLN